MADRDHIQLTNNKEQCATILTKRTLVRAEFILHMYICDMDEIELSIAFSFTLNHRIK